MVVKKVQNRDDWRVFITKLNKEAGKIFNSSRLNSVEECKKYVLNLVKELKSNSNSNKDLEKELNLERDRANAYWEECREKEQRIKKLEVEIAKAGNCKALYKEIDELREEIEFKNKEIEQLKIKYEEMCESRYKFIITAKRNEIELEIQKMHKKAFAGALVVSVLLNILLVWGNL